MKLPNNNSVLHHNNHAIIVGYINDAVKPYMYSTIEKGCIEKKYVSIDRYVAEEIDPHLYMISILGYKYDDNGYYYYRNLNAKMYSYEVIREPIFYSNILGIHTHVIHSHDVDWSKTSTDKLPSKVTLIYLDDNEISHWIDNMSIKKCIEVINDIKHNRMINYVTLDLL